MTTKTKTATPTSSKPDVLAMLATLHRAEQIADEAWRETLSGSTGITVRQAHVLDAVDRSAERPSQTALVELTGIDRSTLADIMRRLVKKGLVARRRTRNDARAYEITLTDGGLMALLAARASASEAVGSLATRIIGLDRLSVVEPVQQAAE